FLPRAELELVHTKTADAERAAETAEDPVGALDLGYVNDRCHRTLLRRLGRVYYGLPVESQRFGSLRRVRAPAPETQVLRAAPATQAVALRRECATSAAARSSWSRRAG